MRPYRSLSAAVLVVSAMAGLQQCKPVQIDEEKTKATDTTTTFKCEGKTFCTEMKSCAEARFYLEHCPGVSLDGDGDGQPCEEQWCGG